MVYLPKISVKDLDVGKLIPSFLTALVTCLLANNRIQVKASFSCGSTAPARTAARSTHGYADQKLSRSYFIRRPHHNFPLSLSQNLKSCYPALVGMECVVAPAIIHFRHHQHNLPHGCFLQFALQTRQSNRKVSPGPSTNIVATLPNTFNFPAHRKHVPIPHRARRADTQNRLPSPRRVKFYYRDMGQPTDDLY